MATLVRTASVAQQGTKATVEQLFVKAQSALCVVSPIRFPVLHQRLSTSHISFAKRQLNGLTGSVVHAAARQESDKWLSDFQETEEAWQVADQLLGLPVSSSGPSSLVSSWPSRSSPARPMIALPNLLPVGPALLPFAAFYGAQTLHVKISFDFDTLPSGSAPSLLQTLIAHGVRFSAGPRNVLGKICLAIVALMVQTGSDGRDACKRVLATYAGNGAARPFLLQLVLVLPEEAMNDRMYVQESNRHEFVIMLKSMSEDVLSFLSEAMRAALVAGNIGEQVSGCIISSRDGDKNLRAMTDACVLLPQVLDIFVAREACTCCNGRFPAPWWRLQRTFH